jgi:hypothetical protein
LWSAGVVEDEDFVGHWRRGGVSRR